MRGMMWMGIQALLQQLEGGRKKINQLRQEAPLYGSTFDWAVTGLLAAGLARRVSEGGEEYLELTEAGRAALSTWGPWQAWPPYPAWGARHGWRHCW